jgi:hypothetical protein
VKILKLSGSWYSALEGEEDGGITAGKYDLLLIFHCSFDCRRYRLLMLTSLPPMEPFGDLVDQHRSRGPQGLPFAPFFAKYPRPLFLYQQRQNGCHAQHYVYFDQLRASSIKVPSRWPSPSPYLQKSSVRQTATDWPASHRGQVHT